MGLSDNLLRMICSSLFTNERKVAIYDKCVVKSDGNLLFAPIIDYFWRKKGEKQRLISEELRLIKEALQQFPNGASMEELRSATTLDISLRTLQRRLEKLVESGTVQLTGATHTARYILPSSGIKAPESESAIPLSARAREIVKILSVPFEQRAKATYNRQFLDRYSPGVDFYLSMHDGNFARYRATPLQFEQWKNVWNK